MNVLVATSIFVVCVSEVGEPEPGCIAGLCEVEPARYLCRRLPGVWRGDRWIGVPDIRLRFLRGVYGTEQRWADGDLGVNMYRVVDVGVLGVNNEAEGENREPAPVPGVDKVAAANGVLSGPDPLGEEEGRPFLSESTFPGP